MYLTVMWFKHFTWRCKELLQFEVTGAFQSETETFGIVLPPPEYVFTEAARPSADVGKIKQLRGRDQGFLVKNEQEMQC